MDNLISLLKKAANEQGRMEVLYVNSLLLDALFVEQFSGVTKLLESIKQSSDVALKSEAGAGFGGALLKLFIDLKASITAEGKIGEQTKTIVEKELTIPLKVRLCETSLEEAGRISDNPPSLTVARGKLLRLVDCLTTLTKGDEDEVKLREELGEDASRAVLTRWAKDQLLTPTLQQIALATRQPFPMAAIVMVQLGLNGSTYITYPKPPSAQRSALAEPLFEDEGVTFLKTYWVIDKYR